MLPMDMEPLLRLLHAQKAALDRAIADLESYAALRGTHGAATVLKRRGRKSMTAAERRAVSVRMKRYWASQRDQPKASSFTAG
jgi:hypothetical protein